jgi:hypothetical protein
MANAVLTPTVIAKEALMILENNLVMTKLVYDGYEDEFSKQVNGYKIGTSLTIRRPTDFTVRSGRTMQVQEVVEGSTTLSVDQQEGIDFEFTSADLTMSIDKFDERILEPAMIQLANDIDSKLTALYKDIPNWVGTPGQVINSFDDFAVGTERLNEFGVPMPGRNAVLSPTDDRGMKSQQTALYLQGPAGEAYRRGKIGMVDNVDTYMDQNVKTHTVGVATGTPLVNGAGQTSNYADVKSTMTQTLNTDGWTNSTTGILKKGDVFTIAGVYAVNPVSKETKPFLRQFVVTADVNSGASTGPAALTISPPIITSGAQQTVSAAPADDAAITVLGTGGTGYRQSMIFHKNAFAFVSVPLAAPNDGRKFSRQRYKGLDLRIVPVYDGINDLNKWRLDVLFGVATLDRRLATRVSGTP